MKELEELRKFLIGLLTEARETAKQARSEQVRMILGSNVALLERITVFISNSIKDGTMDMDKAKMEIKVVATGVVEELGQVRKQGEFTTKIKEIADSLKPGMHVKLDSRGIDWGAFNTRIHNLRAANVIPEEVKPKRSVNGEEGIFLVKLTKQQMSAEPKRRTRTEA